MSRHFLMSDTDSSVGAIGPRSPGARPARNLDRSLTATTLQIDGTQASARCVPMCTNYSTGTDPAPSQRRTDARVRFRLVSIDRLHAAMVGRGYMSECAQPRPVVKTPQRSTTSFADTGTLPPPRPCASCGSALSVLPMTLLRSGFSGRRRPEPKPYHCA